MEKLYVHLVSRFGPLLLLIRSRKKAKQNFFRNFDACPCLKPCFLLDFQQPQDMKPKYIPLYTYFIICFKLHLKRYLTFSPGS